VLDPARLACHSQCVCELRTERLLLRRWGVSDRAPFAALNADPEVFRYFPRPLTPSDRLVEMADAPSSGMAAEIALRGRLADRPQSPSFGWRLSRAAWGQGFATEAARAAAAFAFDELGLEELVSFTAEPNARSRAVMRRLGMRHEPAVSSTA
jgi:RimJ/RimL family protein N-acetyltransferase